MKTRSFLILALLGLHGCNTVDDPFLDGMTATAGTAQTGNRELAPHMARANLTSLGEAPLSVRQTTSEGGTKQEIIYASRTTVPGDNALTIVAGAASQRELRRGPNRSEIAQALKAEFPGIRMSIDPVIRRNGYGPYGTATGKLGNGGGCVYAWQAIEKTEATELDEPLAVRLRYCHPAIGPEMLADLLGGLTLGGTRPLTGTALGSIHPNEATYAYSEPVSVSGTSRPAPAVTRIEDAQEQSLPSAVSDEEVPSAAATAIPMPE